MKFASKVLYISIGAVAAVAEPDDSLRGRRLEKACIESYSISLEGGVCNYGVVAEAVKAQIEADPACKQGTNVADQLRALFMNDRLTLDQVVDRVNDACEDAFYELMYGHRRVSYVDILDDSQQMVKEYFDGRGAVNSQKEFERAIGLGEKIMHQTPFQWPGDSCFDYSKNIPANLKSQFPHDHFAKNHQHKVTSTNRYTGAKTYAANGHGRSAKRDYYAIENFDQCKLNTAMCCWTESTDSSLVFGDPVTRTALDHNTDICYVNMAEAPTSSRARSGFAIFPGLSEIQSGQGSVRCHGFSWAEDPLHVSNLFKGNALFEASFQKHVERGGYVSSVSGAPMCGCLEQMPIVTRADCTEIKVADFNVDVKISKGRVDVQIPDSNKIEFSPCTADPTEAGPTIESSDRKLQDVAAPATTATDAVVATTVSATTEAAATTGADVAVTTTSAETEAPPANVIDLRTHYDLMVSKNLIPDQRNVVAKRLVNEGGCTEVVAEFFSETGIHGYR